jgi:hypothetical protein
MDDLIGEMAGTVMGIALVIVFGVVIGAGWLPYKFCEFVLPPLWRALSKVCDAPGRELRAWWRNVTWEWHVAHAQRAAIRQIDATRAEHVRTCAEFVEALERQGG